MTTIGAFFTSITDCPAVELEAITGGCALVLAPHPDDESLGCGGLIAASCARGQPPVLAMLTDGAGSHPNSRQYPAARLRSLREEETIAAAACLGLPATRIAFLRHPDTAAPATGPRFAVAVEQVVALIRQHGCRSILASWQHDPHCDHEAAALIAAAAARAAAIPHFAYPVWARTLPPDTEIGAPTAVRLDVAPWQDAKRRAIRAHRSQWAGLITDDPAGFQMPPDFIALFDTPEELFLQVSGGMTRTMTDGA
jgi:LmbE family N-acetylglucosaminyl deacetylase